MSTHNNKFKKAFTLVELVVVIAVIAILAAVSTVSYFAITKKANISRVETEAKALHGAIQAYTAVGVEIDSATLTFTNEGILASKEETGLLYKMVLNATGNMQDYDVGNYKKVNKLNSDNSSLKPIVNFYGETRGSGILYTSFSYLSAGMSSEYLRYVSIKDGQLSETFITNDYHDASIKEAVLESLEINIIKPKKKDAFIWCDDVECEVTPKFKYDDLKKPEITYKWEVDENSKILQGNGTSNVIVTGSPQTNKTVVTVTAYSNNQILCTTSKDIIYKDFDENYSIALEIYNFDTNTKEGNLIATDGNHLMSTDCDYYMAFRIDGKANSPTEGSINNLMNAIDSVFLIDKQGKKIDDKDSHFTITSNDNPNTETEKRAKENGCHYKIRYSLPENENKYEVDGLVEKLRIGFNYKGRENEIISNINSNEITVKYKPNDIIMDFEYTIKTERYSDKNIKVDDNAYIYDQPLVIEYTINWAYSDSIKEHFNRNYEIELLIGDIGDNFPYKYTHDKTNKTVTINFEKNNIIKYLGIVFNIDFQLKIGSQKTYHAPVPFRLCVVETKIGVFSKPSTNSNNQEVFFINEPITFTTSFLPIGGVLIGENAQDPKFSWIITKPNGEEMTIDETDDKTLQYTPNESGNYKIKIRQDNGKESGYTKFKVYPETKQYYIEFGPSVIFDAKLYNNNITIKGLKNDGTEEAVMIEHKSGELITLEFKFKDWEALNIYINDSDKLYKTITRKDIKLTENNFSNDHIYVSEKGTPMYGDSKDLIIKDVYFKVSKSLVNETDIPRIRCVDDNITKESPFDDYVKIDKIVNANDTNYYFYKVSNYYIGNSKKQLVFLESENGPILEDKVFLYERMRLKEHNMIIVEANKNNKPVYYYDNYPA